MGVKMYKTCVQALTTAFVFAACLMVGTAGAADWETLPGTAKDVGEGWIISTESAGPHGNGIRRWNGSDWENMPGAAVRIGGTYLQPWVVNSNGNIYRWTGSDWEFVSGTTADDVSEGWTIGTGPGVPGGNTIRRWNGSDWQTIGGAAVRVGGTALDTWVVNDTDRIFRLQF